MALIKLICRWCNEYVDESRFHITKGLPGAESYGNAQCFECRDRLAAEEEFEPIKNRYEILDL